MSLVSYVLILFMIFEVFYLAGRYYSYKKHERELDRFYRMMWGWGRK